MKEVIYVDRKDTLNEEVLLEDIEKSILGLLIDDGISVKDGGNMYVEYIENLVNVAIDEIESGKVDSIYSLEE